MKTLSICVAMAFVLLLAKAGYSQGISGTPHDFSLSAWNTYNYGVGLGEDQICKVCHTPHNASATYDPLWNHEVSGTAAYTLYSNTTFNGSATQTQPDGISKMCLGCHDNTTATNRLDNFVPVNGVTTAIPAAGNLGSDLSNDHPISFDYTAALATTDGGLYDPTTTDAGAPYAAGVKINDVMLFSTKMQCASCHNPHNSTYGKFLRKDNTTSGLCLTCHNK